MRFFSGGLTCVQVELETQCNELMLTKFGKLVDLESLQMLSGNRRLEELKREKLLKEAAHANEIKHWDVCQLCGFVCSSATYLHFFFLILKKLKTLS